MRKASKTVDPDTQSELGQFAFQVPAGVARVVLVNGAKCSASHWRISLHTRLCSSASRASYPETGSHQSRHMDHPVSHRTLVKQSGFHSEASSIVMLASMLKLRRRMLRTISVLFCTVFYIRGILLPFCSSIASSTAVPLLVLAKSSTTAP